jgi:hypothetical protein
MKRTRLEYQVAIYHRSAADASTEDEASLEVAGMAG